MSLGRRVVVTGLGAISALGQSVADNWSAAREGRAGIAIHTLDPGPYGPPPQSLPLARVGQGYERPLELHFGKRVCAGLDPFAALALCAAFEALSDSHLLRDPVLRARTAVVMGHGFGGVETLEKSYQRLYGDKSPRLHPATIPRVMVSAGASAIAMSFDIRGPVFVTSSACASSAHAVAQSAAMIASGLVDVAVTGGSEAIETPGSMRAWEGLHALAAETCRPFSRGRDGMVMGEGGAALILESYDHARGRDARIYGELVGVGMTSDAFHITQPSLEGPVGAMMQATADPEVRDAASILIAAHGTGTALNDQNEASAIRTVFGKHACAHSVIATKSAHGHLIGGSAALQAVLGLRALGDRVAPPILNYLGPDPQCDVGVVTGSARTIECSHLLVNAFAFGGLNVSLAFARV